MLSVLCSTTWFIRLCRRHRCCFSISTACLSCYSVCRKITTSGYGKSNKKKVSQITI